MSAPGADAKAALRRQFRAQRLSLLPQAEAAIQGEARLAIPALLPAGLRLGIYWPLPGEVNLLASLQPLLPERLALPAITGDPGDPTARLAYRPWRSGEPLEADGCGIPAPPASAGELEPQELGLLLIPALAFDAAGIRLGYGGGWYDRLRAELAWSQLPALAVLPGGCRVAQLPCEPWDVPLQGWLDEHGCHWLTAGSTHPFQIDDPPSRG